MTELEDTLSVEELVPDVFLVEVGVVETVGEGKEVVGKVTAGRLVENLLLIRSQILIIQWNMKITNLHTKNLLVERKGHLRILNPDHGVVELVSSGVRSGSGHFCELAKSRWTR